MSPMFWGLSTDRGSSGAKRALGQDRVDVDELFCAVDRIENPPFSDGILAESRKVVRDRFMAQVVDIGREPLRLVQQPLGHGLVDRGEILRSAWLKGEAVPRHRDLTTEGRAARLPLRRRAARRS